MFDQFPCYDVRYDFRIKRCLVCLNFQLFVGGLMSYLCYLCLFVYSGVQHILCCVYALFVFVLCTKCCQFLWIVHSWFSISFLNVHFIKYFHFTIAIQPFQLSNMSFKQYSNVESVINIESVNLNIKKEINLHSVRHVWH